MPDPTPAAPSTQAPPAPAITAPATPAAPTAELTPEQAGKMTSWIREDLAKGKNTPEAAAKAWDQLGATAEQRAPDTRSDEVKQLDATFLPGKPSDYKIAYGNPGEDVVMTKELKAFDTNARGWLAGAGLPRDIGNTLVNTISKVLQTTKDMTPDQLDTYGENEYVKLQKVHGDKLDERLRQAGLMIHDLELKTPGLKHLLKTRGIGDSAMVANLLMGHAPIYHARKGR